MPEMDFMTTALGGAFRSERVIYRAIEDNEADRTFLFTQLQLDPVTSSLGDPTIHRPKNRKESDRRVDTLIENPLLSVMICLPGDSSNAVVPIGYISIKELPMYQRRATLSIQIAPAHQVSENVLPRVANLPLSRPSAELQIHFVISCFEISMCSTMLTFIWGCETEQGLWFRGDQLGDGLVFQMGRTSQPGIRRIPLQREGCGRVQKSWIQTGRRQQGGRLPEQEVVGYGANGDSRARGK